MTLDVATLLHDLLGPLGGAAVAAFIVRQWAVGRLASLKRLEQRARRDELRWAVLQKFMREQAHTVNRNARNLHHMRNFAQCATTALEQLSESVKVRISMPDEPQWEPAQLEVPLDLAAAGEHEDGGEE